MRETKEQYWITEKARIEVLKGAEPLEFIIAVFALNRGKWKVACIDFSAVGERIQPNQDSRSNSEFPSRSLPFLCLISLSLLPSLQDISFGPLL